MPQFSCRIICIGLIIVAVAAGCGTSSPPATSSQVNSTEKSAGSATEPAEPPDPSLSVAEYVKLGLPPIDRLWTAVDMSNGSRVLRQIAKRNPAELPRSGSRKSGLVFDRITNDDNLDQFRDKAKPLRQRVPAAVQFMHGAGTIAKIYSDDQNLRKSPTDEATEMVGLTLRLSVVMNDLAEEAAADLDRKDPRVAAILLALSPIKASLGQRLQDTVEQALALKSKTPEAIDKILGFIDATFPTLVKKTPPAFRREMLTKLQTIRDKPEFAAHTDRFDAIIDKINQALQEADDE